MVHVKDADMMANKHIDGASVRFIRFLQEQSFYFLFRDLETSWRPQTESVLCELTLFVFELQLIVMFDCLFNKFVEW